MLVLGLGDFGRKVTDGTPAGNSPPGHRFLSVRNLIWQDLLGLLEEEVGQARACVVASLDDSDSRGKMEALVQSGPKRPSTPLVSAYLKWFPTERDWLKTVFCPGNPFQDVIVFADVDGSTAEDAIRSAILIRSRMTRPSSGTAGITRYTAATAIPLHLDKIITPLEEVEAEAEILRDVTFESSAIVIEELRRRLDEIVRMAGIAWRDEDDLDVFAELLNPILLWIRSLALEAQIAEGAWKGLLVGLSRGLEVKARLASAVRRAPRICQSLDKKERISHLFDDHNTPATSTTTKNAPEDRDKAAAEKLAGDLPKQFDAETIMKGFQTEPTANLRNSLIGISELILRLLDNPWIFRRIVESLVSFACDQHPFDISIEVPSRVATLKDQLRPLLRGGTGEGAFLVLPKQQAWMAEGEEVRAWLEQSFGMPCEILSHDGSAACFYVERAFDLCGGALSDISVKPIEGSDSGLSQSIPIETSSQGMLDHDNICSECGSRIDFDHEKSSKAAETTHRGTPPLICPRCGHLNKKDWWWCRNHGKSPRPIPSDKMRCPDCILRYHEDPIRYPLSSIGKKPGFEESWACPHCEDLKRTNPAHEVYTVAEDLAPFYKNGVNGHQTSRFLKLAKEQGLVNDYCCPRCGTILIPVDHRELPSGDTS